MTPEPENTHRERSRIPQSASRRTRLSSLLGVARHDTTRRGSLFLYRENFRLGALILGEILNFDFGGDFKWHFLTQAVYNRLAASTCFLQYSTAWIGDRRWSRREEARSLKVKIHVFYFICKFEFNLGNNCISIIIIIEARTIILCVLKFFLFNFIEFQSTVSVYVIFALYHFKNNLYWLKKKTSEAILKICAFMLTMFHEDSQFLLLYYQVVSMRL